MEPLLEIDGDVRSFEVFLSSRTPVLTARDIRTFLPCTVNLDPKLREIIAGNTLKILHMLLLLTYNSQVLHLCQYHSTSVTAVLTWFWSRCSTRWSVYLFSLSDPDVRAAREQMNMGGVTYPSLPLQEAQARPTSVYSQVSSTCSPSASFSGPFNPPAGGISPQPHSSYYSGMAGPQHPFYNRVSTGSTHTHLMVSGFQVLLKSDFVSSWTRCRLFSAG